MSRDKYFDAVRRLYGRGFGMFVRGQETLAWDRTGFDAVFDMYETDPAGFDAWMEKPKSFMSRLFSGDHFRLCQYPDSDTDSGTGYCYYIFDMDREVIAGNRFELFHSFDGLVDGALLEYDSLVGVKSWIRGR